MEKDGYETTYTEWLPVPPPQLDVNVGLKQTTPPMVKQMRGNTSGITIDMSKYMLPATLNTNTISVTSNGMTTNGTIETLNLEKSPTDDEAFSFSNKTAEHLLLNRITEKTRQIMPEQHGRSVDELMDRLFLLKN